jgi:hypothetical protein
MAIIVNLTVDGRLGYRIVIIDVTLGSSAMRGKRNVTHCGLRNLVSIEILCDTDYLAAGLSWKRLQYQCRNGGNPMKPKIFLYWDHKPGVTSAPEYIKLCWETIYKHCGEDFDIHMVTTENVRDYLPNVSDMFFDIAQINNKSNFLRYTLLKTHGGIWLDSDLILFKSLKSTLELLTEEIDLVATASKGLRYGEPECGILVSKRDGAVITKAVQVIEHALSLQSPNHIFKWGSLGPGTIRQAIRGKKYEHMDCSLMMPVPSWEAHRFAGKDSLDKYCNDASLGLMLYHEMFRQCNSPFLRMSRQEILDSPTVLGQAFRKAGIGNV